MVSRLVLARVGVLARSGVLSGKLSWSLAEPHESNKANGPTVIHRIVSEKRGTGGVCESSPGPGLSLLMLSCDKMQPLVELMN